jgi:hypothetical protein
MVLVVIGLGWGWISREPPEDSPLAVAKAAYDRGMRMQFYRRRRGRMLRFPGTKNTMESEEAQRQEGQYILDALRKAGMLLYRLRGRWVRYGGEAGCESAPWNDPQSAGGQ